MIKIKLWVFSRHVNTSDQFVLPLKHNSMFWGHFNPLTAVFIVCEKIEKKRTRKQRVSVFSSKSMLQPCTISISLNQNGTSPTGRLQQPPTGGAGALLITNNDNARSVFIIVLSKLNV